MKIKNGWYDDGCGNLYHYVNNKLHNKKDAGVIYNNGSKFWLQNHKYHRIDGSALEFNDRSKYWYYEGKRIDCKSQQEFDRIIKLKLLW